MLDVDTKFFKRPEFTVTGTINKQKKKKKKKKATFTSQCEVLSLL